MVRKAEKAGLRAQHGMDQLGEFFDLFAANLQRHGTPAFPRRWLENLHAEFGDKMDLLVIRKDDAPVATCRRRGGAARQSSRRERGAGNQALVERRQNVGVDLQRAASRIDDEGRAQRGPDDGARYVAPSLDFIWADDDDVEGNNEFVQRQPHGQL